ncbi:hypothetical protein J2W23_005793 [Variovorax boronicumulans]|uniref:hypothetical protein n=1 Tax=Variovorax boronicumulans TaxID=436515 RepID=UPI00277D1897|nr:hypothetical protein [Variovorax boronicumulans]MDQ0017380.1 hypothetical protein [Variovorax boronicumulans]
MSSNTRVGSTGDGSRPTTSGGVDNIGGAGSFTARETNAGEDVAGPTPRERMQDKKKDVTATKHDDSAPFGLTEDLTPQTNREPGQG